MANHRSWLGAITGAAVLAFGLGGPAHAQQGPAGQPPSGGQHAAPGGQQGGPGQRAGGRHGPGGHDPARRVQELLRRFDRNGDRALEASEVPPNIWQRIAAADVDGDGKVTVHEVAHHLRHRAGRRAADQLFGRLDSNGDGVLDSAELAASPHGQRLLAADTDGDGSVSRAEFDAFLQARHQSAHQVRQAFQAADTNGDHKLDSSEWPAGAAASFADVDADGDGVVSPREVAEYMRTHGGNSPL
ncbi:MAG: hypothetical protein KatS3mg102_0728 [Planctomycetota bacterium]|nr:MAG: hypothetical protein KatS3mg102_0728 [Planctomycetota bacterium]